MVCEHYTWGWVCFGAALGLFLLRCSASPEGVLNDHQELERKAKSSNHFITLSIRVQPWPPLCQDGAMLQMCAPMNCCEGFFCHFDQSSMREGGIVRGSKSTERQVAGQASFLARAVCVCVCVCVRVCVCFVGTRERV
mmetsp:Transcript_1613/g.3964  ORF Transcript_1613/g.3964 Transcript_1613/m.3964 type:complete len:138 (+) Transcript_1613:1632-2045(+)